MSTQVHAHCVTFFEPHGNFHSSSKVKHHFVCRPFVCQPFKLYLCWRDMRSGEDLFTPGFLSKRFCGPLKKLELWQVIEDIFCFSTATTETEFEKKTLQEANTQHPLSNCCFQSDHKAKMAILASDCLIHLLDFSIATSETELSSTKLVFFRPILKLGWPDWLRHFGLHCISCNCWTDFDIYWLETSTYCPLPSFVFFGPILNYFSKSIKLKERECRLMTSHNDFYTSISVKPQRPHRRAWKVKVEKQQWANCRYTRQREPVK